MPGGGLSDGSRGFLALDGLRGIAALAIVLRHGLGASVVVLPRSYLAVDLFFALSGFVLFHVYVPRFERGLRPGTFFVQRLIRLYPLYFAGTFAAVALSLAGAMIGTGAHPPVGPMAASGVLNILFLPVPPGLGLYGASAFPFNFPAWSLFWELVINGVFALAVLWLTPARLIAIVLVGAVVLVGSGWYFHGLDTGSTHATFLGGGGRVIYSFFVGGIVHAIWASRRVTWRLSFPVASILLLLSFAARPTGDLGAAYDLAIAVVAYPILLLLTANAVANPRTARLCRVLGVSSYAIYAIHAAVILAARMIYPHVAGGTYEDASPLIAIVVCAGGFIAALLLDRYYDQPLRAWLSRRFIGDRVGNIGEKANRKT